MKTTVSLPDPISRLAGQLAERLGITRSQLYCRAIQDLLARHDEAAITARLDSVYHDPNDNSGLEPGFAALQSRAVRHRSRRR